MPALTLIAEGPIGIKEDVGIQSGAGIDEIQQTPKIFETKAPEVLRRRSSFFLILYL